MRSWCYNFSFHMLCDLLQLNWQIIFSLRVVFLVQHDEPWGAFLWINQKAKVARGKNEINNSDICFIYFYKQYQILIYILKILPKYLTRSLFQFLSFFYIDTLLYTTYYDLLWGKLWNWLPINYFRLCVFYHIPQVKYLSRYIVCALNTLFCTPMFTGAPFS